MARTTHIFSVVCLMGMGCLSSAQAGEKTFHCAPKTTKNRPVNRVVYKQVQKTPLYNLQRPEVVSGARLTVFANFLRQEKGYVFFVVNGTTADCQVHAWNPNSVTFDLPRLGLGGTQNATIQVVLPDGRVAKSISVVLVPQPDIVIHEETIPQPLPPAASSAVRAVYAESPADGQASAFVE